MTNKIQRAIERGRKALEREFPLRNIIIKDIENKELGHTERGVIGNFDSLKKFLSSYTEDLLRAVGEMIDSSRSYEAFKGKNIPDPLISKNDLKSEIDKLLYDK